MNDEFTITLNEDEADLALTAMYDYRRLQLDALRLMRGYSPPGTSTYTEHDYGIPKINALIDKLEAE